MTTTAIILSLMAVLAVNLAALALMAWLLRRKHRYLFGFISEASQRFDRHGRYLDAELRKATRLADYRIDHPGVEPRLPLDLKSQSGEDTYLYDLFKGQDRGFFIEAGACDGVRLSNTYFFESTGWEGLLVEAHPDLFKSCRTNRPYSTVVHAAIGPDSAEGTIEFSCAEDPGGPGPLSFVKADAAHMERCRRDGYTLRKVQVPFTSLNALLHGLTETVDLVSLDVEGMEVEALQGFDIAKYQPKALVIETVSSDERKRIDEYLARFSYAPAIAVGRNTIYVPQCMPRPSPECWWTVWGAHRSGWDTPG